MIDWLIDLIQMTLMNDLFDLELSCFWIAAIIPFDLARALIKKPEIDFSRVFYLTMRWYFVTRLLTRSTPLWLFPLGLHEGLSL